MALLVSVCVHNTCVHMHLCMCVCVSVCVRVCVCAHACAQCSAPSGCMDEHLSFTKDRRPHLIDGPCPTSKEKWSQMLEWTVMMALHLHQTNYGQKS